MPAPVKLCSSGSIGLGDRRRDLADRDHGDEGERSTTTGVGHRGRGRSVVAAVVVRIDLIINVKIVVMMIISVAVIFGDRRARHVDDVLFGSLHHRSLTPSPWPPQTATACL
jgi:hypothetical protein